VTSSLSGEILRFSNSSFRIVSNSALADSKSKSSLNWVGGADLPPVLNFLSLEEIEIKKNFYLILVVSIWKVSLVILIGAAVVIILSIALVIVTSIALK